MSIVKIISIPDISTLHHKSVSFGDMDTEYKIGFASLLSEIYQNYKTTSKTSVFNADFSIEILWTTSSVNNQPYNANINLYLILRSIAFSPSKVKDTISGLTTIVQETLKQQKYEYQNVIFDDFISSFKMINDEKIIAIIKEKHLENLHNPILPLTYSFDKFISSDLDLSKIVNTLIEHPNCALSFQLIPTQYSEEENNTLGIIAQTLDTLKNGIMHQDIGNISYSLTEKDAITYGYYNQNKNGALFFYNILVYGDSKAVDNISTKVYGHLNANVEKPTDIKFIAMSPKKVQKNDQFYPLPWAINVFLQSKEREINESNIYDNFVSFYRFPYIITAEEASEFFRLPLGSSKIAAGLTVNKSDHYSKTYYYNVINGGDIEVGKLKSSLESNIIGFTLNDLTKHMLVVGTPGSGKTTFSIGLLDRLWKKHNIPFLVIEPAKNEYRALVHSIPNIQIFTPGKNHISPFRYNPFVPPRNVKLETYKITLKTAFAAAVSMSTPLDKIFEETINNCYSDFRWLDYYTSDDKGQTFNIVDFIHCFKNTFNDIGYTGDAKNIGLAGVVRLNSLVNLFDNYYSIPIEDLLKKPTIIELAAIENSDQKALIISLLLLSVMAYVNANYTGEGTLKNLILLEEAHVLLDTDINTGYVEANPNAIAQRLLKRMLAEIRAYGIGIVIADQSPRRVTNDVISLTDIKLGFRLVEAQDKQIFSDSTNMSETQVQRLGKLKPGEAFLYFNKLDEPEEIKIEDYRSYNNIKITLSDEQIKSLSTYWNDKKEHLRPYPECSYVIYCQETCEFTRRQLAKEIARRIYVKNLNPKSDSIESIKIVFSHISKLVIEELNDELFDKELLACVKVHLWRKINYDTKIQVSKQAIQTSLGKT